MSGTRGGSQSFGIRLSLDGADAVESGLRRVQATANTAATSIEQAGQSTGRALAVIERGTDAASAGLRRMGGDFAALAPLVDGAGGAVGRLVTALGSGAGLLGVLGAVGGAVGAAVAVYQNWDAVTRAVTNSMDALTGRVRAVRAELQSTYDLLNQLNGIAPQAASTQARGAIERIDGQASTIRDRLAQNERALEAARANATPGQIRAFRTGPGGAALSPESEAQLQREIERAAERRANSPETQARIAEIEANLRADRAALADLEAARRRQQGIIGAAEENVGSVLTQPPSAATPTAAPRGGGGGRAAADPFAGLAGRRDAFLAQNDPLARYQQRLEAIGQLQADLAAAGQSPLPDEAVVRATDAALQDYERSVSLAGASTRNLADGTKEWERASMGAAKALTSAFEDLVFEGASFDDVLKNLERSLLRIGNQTLLQPLFQQGFNALFGGGGGNLKNSGGGGAGLIGQGISFLASLVAHDGAVVGAGGGTMRAVPASLFADAPRFHSGGMIGPDERPVIAQVGERILSRAETAAYNRGGGVHVHFHGVTDAVSFRNSEAQIMAKLAQGLGRAGRNR